MAAVSSEHGGLVTCNGGPHRMPDGTDAIKALSWRETHEIVDKFKSLNPYNKKVVPGSVLNIVEEINYDSTGKQRQLYGYGISAKRYSVHKFDGSRVVIVKASEHGLGLTPATCWRHNVLKALNCSIQHPDARPHPHRR